MKWYLFSICLIVLDQVTKYLVRTTLAPHQTIQLLPILAITYVTNTGTIFGWFQGRNEMFVGVISLILILLIFYSKSVIKEFGTIGKLALCLIFSGGIGNLIDRIFFGKVVDFIDLQWNYRNIWPVFNFADSYVFVGICTLIVKHFISLKTKQEN